MQVQRGPGRRATLCVCLSNSKLQTRCNGADREDNTLETRGEELFLTPDVYRSMLFSFNLLTTAISSHLQFGLTIRTFHSYFLRLVVSHDLLSTDVWFFLFPSILVAQVLVGAMGNTPPIWMWCWGHFCWLFSLDGFCTFACGALTGILHLYTWNTLLSFRPFSSSLSFHFNLQLSTSRRSILLFEFLDKFFSRTRERRVIGCMDRFTLPCPACFHQFR